MHETVDAILRRSQRAYEEARDDTVLRYQYRISCVRAGNPELAGLEVGDIVEVDEVESPWIRGPWMGEVLRVFEAGDKYVTPLSNDQNYRVRPSLEYLARGLYLTRLDMTILITPRPPP